MTEPVRPQKITFADMRARGVRGLLLRGLSLQAFACDLTIAIARRGLRTRRPPPVPGPAGDLVTLKKRLCSGSQLPSRAAIAICKMGFQLRHGETLPFICLL